MKKIFFLIFIALLCFGFASCGGKMVHSSDELYICDGIPGYTVQLYYFSGTDSNPKNPKDIHEALEKSEIPFDYVYYIDGKYLVFKKTETPK